MNFQDFKKRSYQLFLLQKLSLEQITHKRVVQKIFLIQAPFIYPLCFNQNKIDELVKCEDEFLKVHQLAISCGAEKLKDIPFQKLFFLKALNLNIITYYFTDQQDNQNSKSPFENSLFTFKNNLKFQNLQRISLKFSTVIKKQGDIQLIAQAIKSQKELKQLSLSFMNGSKLTQENFSIFSELIQQIKNLVSLELNINDKAIHGNDLCNLIKNSIQKLPNLEKFTFVASLNNIQNSTAIQNLSLGLQNCPKLQQLTISIKHQDNQEDLIPLSECLQTLTQLKKLALNLNNASISEQQGKVLGKAISEIKSLRALQLSFYGNNRADLGERDLTMTILEELSKNISKINDLKLNFYAKEEQGNQNQFVQYFDSFKEIQKLELIFSGKFEVSDQAFTDIYTYIFSLKDLNHLNLSINNSQITKKSIQNSISILKEILKQQEQQEQQRNLESMIIQIHTSQDIKERYCKEIQEFNNKINKKGNLKMVKIEIKGENNNEQNQFCILF